MVVRGGKDKTEHLTASGVIALAPGTYRMETHDARGVVVDRREATFGPGPRVMDLTEILDSPLRHALLHAIPGAHGNGLVEFSETLGPTPDQGLDLWLALIGGSRIIGGPGEFSKLGLLPLATFDDPGTETGVYVLAGFEQSNVRLRASLGEHWRVPLTAVPPHATLPGLFEIAVPGGRLGYRYLTVQVDRERAHDGRRLPAPRARHARHAHAKSERPASDSAVHPADAEVPRPAA